MGLSDLAFLAAALRNDKTYDLGALIAYRLTTNREKGGVCGGLVASRLLALHGLAPHPLDFLLPIEKLDIDSMKKHNFIADHGSLHVLPYIITFPKRQYLKVSTIVRTVILPAPPLNLYARENWSVSEAELDTLEGQHGPSMGDNEEEHEGDFSQPPETAGSSYPDPGYAGPSGSSSTAAEPEYDFTRVDPPGWNHYSPWG